MRVACNRNRIEFLEIGRYANMLSFIIYFFCFGGGKDEICATCYEMQCYDGFANKNPGFSRMEILCFYKSPGYFKWRVTQKAKYIFNYFFPQNLFADFNYMTAKKWGFSIY